MVSLGMSGFGCHAKMVNFFIDVSFGTPGMCVHDVIT
jgi:hypothetical protein